MRHSLAFFAARGVAGAVVAILAMLAAGPAAMGQAAPAQGSPPAVSAMPVQQRQIHRRVIGTTVFAGMLAATTFGILLVPGLFVLFQTLRETATRRSR